MKKVSLHKSLLLLIGIVISIYSCKKEESMGNADIDSYTFDASPWSYSSPNYYINLSVPALTSANINSSAVMVYFKTTSHWIALPYTQYNSPLQNYIMGFSTTAGTVQVTWFYDTSLFAGDDPNEYYSTIVQLKVVVVSSRTMELNPNLDLTNYEEVKSHFNLQD